MTRPISCVLAGCTLVFFTYSCSDIGLNAPASATAYLAYVNLDHNLEIIGVPGGQSQETNVYAGTPIYSPTRNAIALYTRPTFEDLWLGVYYPETDSVRYLAQVSVPGIYVIEDVQWSPDGGRLAFSSRLLGNRSIHLVSVLDGVETALPTKGESFAPQWSPNGRNIAYWTLSPEDSNLRPAVISIDGSLDTTLRIPFVAGSPHWLSDQELVFNYKTDSLASNFDNVAKFNLATRVFSPLTSDNNTLLIDVLDVNHLLLGSRFGDLRRVSILELSTMNRSPWFEALNRIGFKVSPDRNLVASFGPSESSEISISAFTIYVQSTSDNVPQKIALTNQPLFSWRYIE